jgi:hypothetical protein
LHGLRATFITRGLDAGVPAVAVQKLVGHADLAITTKYYRNTEQSQSAAETIRKAIGIAVGSRSGATGPSVSHSPTASTVSAEKL